MMRGTISLLGCAMLLLASASAQGAGLRNEDLVGKWCLRYTERDGRRQTENRNWHFREDGTYLWQHSKTSAAMSKGRYTIVKNRIETDRMINLEVESIDDRQMTAKWFIGHHFTRGTCQ